MHKNFEQRRLTVASAFRENNNNDLIADILAKTSEQLLAELPQSSWTPSMFRDAAKTLAHDARLIASLHTEELILPSIGSETAFNYLSEYLSAPNRAVSQKVTVAVATEQGRVIGFGIASSAEANRIEILDVDRYSRRFAGLAFTVNIEDVQFGVGVGHILVDTLMTALTQPVFVDATNADSRYIFKSLGFIPYTASNTCLLRFP